MSIFSKLFGSSKKDYTYSGPRPPATTTNLPGGKEYYQTIQDRLAGRNVGFGESYADKYANPITANMRNNFTSYQLPNLKDELSATGRRSSSNGFDQIRRAYQEQGLNESDVFSRLQQRNEDQMRNEINDAFARSGDLGKTEAGLLSNLANFEYANNEAQVNREQDRMKRESEGYKNLITAAGSVIAAPYTGGASLVAMPQYSTGQVGGDPTIGYGKSGRSLNERLAQRAAIRGGYYR